MFPHPNPHHNTFTAHNIEVLGECSYRNQAGKRRPIDKKSQVNIFCVHTAEDFALTCAALSFLSFFGVTFVFLFPPFLCCRFSTLNGLRCLFLSPLPPSPRHCTLPCARGPPIDELYSQKLKYKAISEELDHALNDMTSM